MKFKVLHSLLVIDIETAPVYADFETMDKDWQELWSEKVLKANPDANVIEQYRLRSGTKAEFAKIVCIGIGYVDEGNNMFSIRSFYGNNETSILNEFLQELKAIFAQKETIKFAGHNIREFDLPFICRRLLVNGMTIPSYLDFQNKKPWEINVVDTFQWWRFGDYKNYTSLKLLAKVMGVKGSKNDIDGSMVAPLYWEKNPVVQKLNLHNIAHYCCMDVLTTTNVIRRFMGSPSLDENLVLIIHSLCNEDFSE
jgi:predicted PolB exonuclease-like 3'-5' exonuclease